MKNHKRGIVTAFATWLFCLTNAAVATDKPQIVPKPAAPIVLVEKERDYTAALVGAGITYWLMRRRAKKQPEPVAVVPPAAACPTTEERVERIIEACAAK